MLNAENLINMKTLNQFLLLASTGVLLTSCSGGDGSVSSSGSGSSSLSLAVTSLYPTSSGSSWTAIVDGSNRTFVKGQSVTAEGTCSRGVATVLVSEGSSLFSSESVSCDSTGAWSWTKSFSAGAQQNYSVTFTPVFNSGTPESSSAVTKLIRVDDLAPTAPSITSPSASGSYTQTSGTTVTVSGTVSSDVTRITGPSGADSATGAGGLTLTGTNFSITLTLSVGTTAYSFVGYDLSGNPSSSGTISISYIPAISLAFGGAISGGTITGTGGYSAEVSVEQVPEYATDSGGFSLNLGFNRMVNTGRAQ